MSDGSLSPVELDPGLRRTIALLNRLPGAATHASCQGRTAAAVATHADLAYVLFREPMPLTLEDHFLEELGEIARVEPDGVHCRWPERNAEFCERLERAVEARLRSLEAERWRMTIADAQDSEDAIVERLLGDVRGELAWCRDCRRLDSAAEHREHANVALFRASETQTLAVFRDYLAIEPLDARLVERVGERGVLDRLRHGDFGDAYRDGWSRHARTAARGIIRGEIRSVVRSLRTGTSSSDYYFDTTVLVLAEGVLA